MDILWLSTGLFKDKYGQQNQESCLLTHAYLQRERTYNFKVLLLNDIHLPTEWNRCANKLNLSCYGSKRRLFSKLKFALFSLWHAIKYKPVFLVCGHINLSFLCLFFLYFFKIKYSLITYGMDIWDIKRNRFKIKALKHARAIITMSYYTASKIKEQIPLLPDKKIFIIPPYIDTQRFKPAPKPENLLREYALKDSKVILTVARLSSVENKGYDNVIMALPTVIKIIPNLKYLIIGGGDDVANIMRLAKKLGVKDYLVLTDFIAHEELPSYYNLCDLFIMPSKQEGFGIVFLEALACGKPVIAGNKDGSKEALLDGKLGLLVDPDDINQISETIIKVLKKDVDSHFLDAKFLSQSVIENFGLERFRHRITEALDYIENEI